MSASVRVEVSYRLGEYMAMVREFIPRAAGNKSVTSRTPATGFWSRPIWVNASLWLLIPPIFFLKVLRVGRCEFSFTQEGLSRKSRGRTVSKLWQEVVAVHKLSAAYLIELEEGAVPVPYRVFPPGAQQRFESYALAKLVRAASDA